MVEAKEGPCAFIKARHLDYFSERKKTVIANQIKKGLLSDSVKHIIKTRFYAGVEKDTCYRCLELLQANRARDYARIPAPFPRERSR